MGGDIGPSCTIAASVACLKQDAELKLVLVGQEQAITPFLVKIDQRLLERIEIVHAVDVIAMDDPVAIALRSKPDSSMRKALELVRDGKADACVSAGNTGALMALARRILKTLPGIDRPAMMCALPTQKGSCCYLLDLGANVDCTAEQLFEFAVMGSVTAKLLGIKQPKVGLLNVGSEAIKGNQQVKQATRLLESQTILDYVGFIEADEVFKGVVDVVVCDGFAGNVFLKASEGVVKLLIAKLEQRFCSTWFGKLKAALILLPLFKGLYKDLAPDYLNGASFLGLHGVVVKSHGAANVKAFQAAIMHANNEVSKRLQQHLATQFYDLFKSGYH